MKHGHGEIHMVTNEYFNGQFENDKKNGFGKDVDAEGNSYIGEFKDNVFHG